MLGRILLLCGLVVCLGGCTAKYHTRMAKKHIEKARAIDSSVVKADTILVPRDTVIESPGIQIDTLVDSKSPTDTVTIKKDGVTVKTVYDPVKKKQYVRVDKPVQKDTVRINDKVITDTVIVTEKPQKIKLRIPFGGWVAIVLGGLILIGSFFRKYIG